MSSTINYGDIVIAHLSPVRGHEIAKARPCVVVSRNMINQYTPLRILIPLTTNVTRVYPYQVIVKPSRQNGLSKDSKVLPEQVKSVDRSRLVKKIGVLEGPALAELETKLLFILNQRETF